MATLSRFGGCFFCVATAITLLTGCNSGAISSSTPWSRTDATAPLKSYPMRIKNDTSFEIHFGSADDRCMLQAPPDELLQANHDWKGDIITKTHDECEDRGAKFILLIEFSAGGADGEWQKPPGSPWRVVNKEQDGLCIVEVGSALDVSITPEPQSGCH